MTTSRRSSSREDGRTDVDDVTAELRHRRASRARKARCHRARRLLVFLAVVLAAPYAVAVARAHVPQLPPVGRPIAPIISPSYSTEETRDRLGEAERVMDRLAVKPGLRVADIGAGDGYYTVRLARRLGHGATIYAEDVEQRYLDGLAARLAREGISGVKLAHDALAARGRVAIIDNDKPTAEHGTPPALLRGELGAVGSRQVDFVWLAPADGYLAVFAPPEASPPPSAMRPCRH
jgi:hypothetical protein